MEDITDDDHDLQDAEDSPHDLQQELRSVPLLKTLSDDELVQLVALLHEQTIKKGTYIVHQGEPGPSLMMILSGRVKITLISSEGKEVVLAHFAPGDFFGEISLLTETDRSANVVAQTDCKLAALSASDFINFLSQSPNFSLAMMRALARRLRSATAKIGDLALYDVYQRVLRALFSLASETHQGEELSLVIDERPTHQELSTIVGTSREMVTRALKSLEDDGYIVMNGKRIEIRKIPE